MDAAELRATQAPFKERYKSDPKTAMITLTARGSIDHEGIACKVETGRALAMAGLHPATGGSGLELCSGDMLLEALVACAGVTLKSVATAIEVPLKKGDVSAEGDLDFRGTLGIDKEAPVGFAEIRLSFEVDTDGAAGQARPAVEAHRALLRGLPDHQERPEGFGVDAQGVRLTSSLRKQEPTCRVLSFQEPPFDGFRATRIVVVMGPCVRRDDRKCPPNSQSS